MRGAIVADVRIPMNLLLHKWRWVKFSLFYQDGGHWLSSLIGHYERRNKAAVFAQNSKQWKNSTIVAKMCYGIILELRWRFGHWLANPLTNQRTVSWQEIAGCHTYFHLKSKPTMPIDRSFKIRINGFLKKIWRPRVQRNLDF